MIIARPCYNMVKPCYFMAKDHVITWFGNDLDHGKPCYTIAGNWNTARSWYIMINMEESHGLVDHGLT